MRDKNAAAKRIAALIEQAIPLSPSGKRERASTHADGRATLAWGPSVIRVVTVIDTCPDGPYQSKGRDISARAAAAPADRARSNAIRSACVDEGVPVLQ